MRPLSPQLLVTLCLLLPSALAQAPEPEDLEPNDGVALIPDRATYETLSYTGNAGRDSYLNDIQFVKFILQGAGGEDPKMYFMNTKTRQAHPRFMQAMGMGGGFGPGGGRGRGRGEEPADPAAGRQMRGAIAFYAKVQAPDGTAGTYGYNFQPNDVFPLELLAECHATLLEKAPVLEGKLVYHPLSGDLKRAIDEPASYTEAGVPIYLDEDFDQNLAYLGLNLGVSFGRLRVMTLEEVPSARDIVVYSSLPNELPRVAGILTAVRQTPLSHVNLRAIQDRVPNAYVDAAVARPDLLALVGKYVRYAVGEDGYSLREATETEVDEHLASLRPTEPQVPPLDLTITEARALGDIEFGQAGAFGVKTTNLASMLRMKLAEGVVPNGFGVPFAFYDAFMKHNGLDAEVAALLANAATLGDADALKAALKALRKKIRDGEMPAELHGALGEIHSSFPKETRLRCRSSTNNEDLPGFSGAGLYGSYTHKPDEGHLSKTVQQVFASLWGRNAFDERQFYRVDHTRSAMGVLIHPSFKDERANGVAVTLDVLYRRYGYNYVNVQVGEDMVTNPEALSIPEEVLLPWERGRTRWMQASNRVGDGELVLSVERLGELQSALELIHGGFADLYGKKAEDPTFAMEVEFKVTAEGQLAIKQARPWVFSKAPEDQ